MTKVQARVHGRESWVDRGTGMAVASWRPERRPATVGTDPATQVERG